MDLEPETVTHSGRLGPGEMLVVDLVDGGVFENDGLLTLFDTGAPYATLLETVAFEPAATDAVLQAAELLALQRGFGYTREDVKMVLQPMAADGKDSVWSMGDDAPLAFLARSPRPVYAYFRQRFAQVTNPAIDPLREAGGGEPAYAAGAVVAHAGQECAAAGDFSTVALSVAGPGGGAAARGVSACGGAAGGGAGLFVWRGGNTDGGAGQDLRRGGDAGAAGATILLLTDRNASSERLPVPMAMATGAVHQALVAAGLRTEVGLAVEAGDCRIFTMRRF